MLLKISQEELQKNRNLDPGWYPAKFEKLEAKPAAVKPGKPSSTNYYAWFIIQKDERRMSFMFNSQMMQMAEKMVTVLMNTTVKTDPNDPKVVTADIEFDEGKAAGQPCQVKVIDDPYQGRLISKIDDFAPIDKDMSAGVI